MSFFPYFRFFIFTLFHRSQRVQSVLYSHKHLGICFIHRHNSMKLITSDEEVFEIDAKIATLSGLLVDFLNEDGDDNNGEPIPLAKVTSDVMKKVIEWAEHHKDDPIQEKEEEERRTDDISSWDANFLKVDQSMVFSLIAAANYLKIDGPSMTGF